MNQDGPKIVGPAEVGEDTLRWEKKAAELEFEALSKVRGAAEKWAATLTALLGLIGTVAIIKGPEEVGDLGDDAKLAIGVLLAIAFLAALTASLLAAYAAQGTPKDLKWPNGPGLRKWEHDEAQQAKQQLFWSRFTTVAAVLLIAAAAAVAWLADSPAKSGSTVLFTPTAGQPLCGSLVNGAKGLQLKVGEKQIALPSGPYDQVVPVDSCPEEKPAEDKGK